MKQQDPQKNIALFHATFSNSAVYCLALADQSGDANLVGKNVLKILVAADNYFCVRDFPSPKVSTTFPRECSRYVEPTLHGVYSTLHPPGHDTYVARCGLARKQYGK